MTHMLKDAEKWGQGVLTVARMPTQCQHEQHEQYLAVVEDLEDRL